VAKRRDIIGETTFAERIPDRFGQIAHRIDHGRPSMGKAFAKNIGKTGVDQSRRNDNKGSTNGDDHAVQFEPGPRRPLWIGTGHHVPPECATGAE
jgi:hypothetical protein